MHLNSDTVYENSVVENGIEIELTNHCGYSCRICPRTKLKQYGFMSFDTFKAILDLIEGKGYEEIMVCGLGDAFLHPDIFEFVDYLFERMPDITLSFMTKGQSITDAQIAKIAEYHEKGFHLSVTFSVFSITPKIYNHLTGGDNYGTLMSVIKKFHQSQIPFSMELLISVLTLGEVEAFKKISTKFGATNSGFGLVNNWSGQLSDTIYQKLFDKNKLQGYYTPRQPGDICEVIQYNGLYINSAGEVLQCSLNELGRHGVLGKIGEYSLEEFLEKKRAINQEISCKDCTYYDKQINVLG